MELQVIQNKIYEIRGRRVMLDFDLARLYEIETRALKQAVRRNIERFPEDFLLKLNSNDVKLLILNGVSQIVTPPGYNVGSAGMFAFTEQGVAMLSSVLRSEAAIRMNIGIMRAFVAMRNYLMTTSTVTAELAEIRTKLELLERNDEDMLGDINDLSEDIRKDIDNLYNAIGELSIKPVPSPRKPIGFKR